MFILIFWRNIIIGTINFDEVSGRIEYVLHEQAVKFAKSMGMLPGIIGSDEDKLPGWIEERIPVSNSKSLKAKLEYLKETGGRLQTDAFHFQ